MRFVSLTVQLMTNNIKQILFAIFCVAIGLAGCVKTDLTKYSKDSLTLAVKQDANGDDYLEWSAVKTSDFVQYEVYAAGTTDIEIIKNSAQIIATIKDPEITTLEVPSVVNIDSSSNNKINFKVAAVLRNRKLGSNVVAVPRTTIFSSNTASPLFYMDGTDLFILLSNSATSTMSAVNVADGTISASVNWPFINQAFTFNSFSMPIRGGTNASGTIKITENLLGSSGGGNLVKIYNATTFAEEASLTLTNYQAIYNCAMRNGILYVIGQDVGGNTVLSLHTVQGSSAPLMSTSYNFNMNSNCILHVSEDGTKAFVLDPFGSSPSTAYTINTTTGAIAVAGTANTNSSVGQNAYEISGTGNRLINGSSSVLYDAALQPVQTLVNVPGFAGTGCLTADGSKAFWSAGAGVLATCNVFDANTGVKTKTVKVHKGSENMFSLKMFSRSNNLYAAYQIQDALTFQVVTIIKKINY
jgi:hypothetical protein